MRDLGAIPFDYKQPIEFQVKEVMSITSRRPFRIFDAAATGDDLARELFQLLPDDTDKYFATTGQQCVLLPYLCSVDNFAGCHLN